MKYNARSIKNVIPRKKFIALAIGSALSVTSAASFSEILQLEEVTVTAQKRTESIQDIPVSVTAMTANDLQGSGIQDVSDVILSVPAMSYMDRGGSFNSIGIRGITSEVRSAGMEDSVGMYVDGVYIGRSSFFNLDLADLEQIEVLRGPQGTLFGKNTVAGALNITTKPVDLEEFKADVNITFGNDGYQRYIVKANVPISDTFGFAISGLNKKSDGWVKNLGTGNDLMGGDEDGARIKIRWDASDKLSFDFAADYMNRDTNNTASNHDVEAGTMGTTALLASLFGDSTGANLGGPDYTNYDAAINRQRDWHTIEEETDTFDNQDYKSVALTTKYSFDSEYELTYIASWSDMESLLSFDDDNIALVDPALRIYSVYNDTAEQTTHEIRLASPVGENFDYQIGLFFYDQEVESDRNVHFSVFGDVLGFGGIDIESKALYTHGNYRLTDQLTLTAGIRASEDEKEASWNQNVTDTAVFDPSGSDSVAGLPDAAYSDKDTWNNVSSTVSLTYEVTDQLTTYIKYAEGFKSGGFATELLLPNPDVKFDSEEAEVWELGVKGDFLDNTLRLSGAIYRMDYSDIQIPTFLNIGVEVQQDSATIDGGEVEFTWLLSQNWTLKGGVGYIDGEYEDLNPGNDLRNAPKLTGNLAINYEQSLGEGTLLATLDASYKDEVYFHQGNNEPDPVDRVNFYEATHEDAYTLVNARLGYLSADESWSVYLWGKNLGDKEYATYRRELLSDYQYVPGQPVSYGIDINYSF